MNSQYNNVDFKGSLKIVANSVTGEEDTIEITLTAINNDSKSHYVGMRIMLDTMLGTNDDAPFRVNGYGAITTKTQFEGSNVPTNYNTFDSLTNPKIVTAGTFLSGAGKPDIVQFTNYWDSRGSQLIPPVYTGQDIGDSTVNAIWNPRTLAPGASMSCRTYYGLSHMDVSAESELVLGANKSAGEFVLNEDGTGYEPVSITSFLQNTGVFDLTNVEVSLMLPNGMSVENGAVSKQYSSLAVGSEVIQDTWVLHADSSGLERRVKVVVEAKSDQTGAVKPVELTFTIPAIEGAPTIDEADEPETEPETQPIEETTVAEETTAAPDDDAQSSTDPVATPAEATPADATVSQVPVSTNGAIQTGAALPVVVILSVLVSAISAVFYFRKKQG